MGKLKPIGSEKLEGQEKIKRMLEIARFNEATPNNINETSRTEFSLPLADGHKYEIVKEKQGYIIKRMISESKNDYIDPIKNRKYYSSYSQALKRLNLLAAELNRLNENEEGVSLFGEEKKFVLKTPKPKMDSPAPEAPPASPPPVPSPELPPSPIGGGQGGEEPMGDLGGGQGGEEPMGDLGGGQGGEEPMGDLGGEEGGEEPMGNNGNGKEGEGVTFKLIQKLTGKLTQKIRELENKEGMTSEDIKYVINMVLSSLELNSLSDEDKEDVMMKFEDDEMGGEDMGGEDMGGEDMGDEEEPMGELGGEKPSPEEGELGEIRGALIDSIFSESKVDKVLSKYFEYSKKEILETKNLKKIRSSEINSIVNSKMKPIVRLAETIEQEIASQRFLQKNHNFVFIGKTNKNNLIFENKNKQIKISPEGLIL